MKVLVAYVLLNFEVCSNMSMDDLNQAWSERLYPFPDLGIEFHPRQ